MSVRFPQHTVRQLRTLDEGNESEYVSESRAVEAEFGGAVRGAVAPRIFFERGRSGFLGKY